MKLPKFKLEEFFAKHEFSAPYMMGSSDGETHTVAELIAMADSETLFLWNHLKLSYTETHGLPLLREEISKLYTSQKKENILVFSGAEEAIFITMQTLLKPGDHVIVLTPCYQSLNEIPKTIGAKVSEFSLDWVNGNWQFNLEEFSKLISAETKLVVLNFPHNPTGFHPDQRLFQEIMAVVKKHNVYLLSDEVYRLSEQNPADCLPNAVDCYEKALSLGVMSKSFGLPGLRIGWIAAREPELLHQFASYKNYTTICNSATSEIFALMALRAKEKILSRNRLLAKDNLNLLDQFFAQHSKIFDWYRPKAGFINFPRLKLPIPIDEFVEKLIAEQGVIILPGTLFDNRNNHFRLGFCRKNLPEALERFSRFVESIN